MIPALVVPVLNRPDLLNRLLGSIDYGIGDLLVIDPVVDGPEQPVQ